MTFLLLCALAAGLWMQTRALTNDAFVDEATYIVSGQLLRDAAETGADTPPIAMYLSGAPHLYPRLAAALFEREGLEGVRVFSFACIVAAMLAVYAAAGALFTSRVAGLAAAALFSVQAPVLFLARFATYDALCVALLAISLAAALDGGARRRWLTAMLAGMCIAAAALIKYASLLYVPCIVLVSALVLARNAGWKRGAVTLVAALVTGIVLALPGAPGELWTGFVTTTLSRSVTSGGRVRDIVLFAISLGGAMAVLALPSLALVSARMRWVALTLFAFAFLAPLNHARLHEFVSLHKHMAFAIVLWSALAGGTVAALAAWVVRRWRSNQIVIAVAVSAAAAAIVIRAIVLPGASAADRLFRYWPDSTRAAYLALAPVTGASARFLSEEPDLGTLYLGKRAPVSQWVHPYYFDYDGQRARTPSDVDPYRRAIRDGYFSAVVLRFGPQRDWATAIEEELLHAQPRYRLAARLPFELADGAGAYQLWVRTDAIGAERVGQR